MDDDKKFVVKVAGMWRVRGVFRSVIGNQH